MTMSYRLVTKWHFHRRHTRRSVPESTFVPYRMSLFPLFANLNGRAVLVVGGGDVATRKTRALLRAGAQVSVGARELSAELADWSERGRIRALRGDFQPAWLEQVWLVVAATDDAALNRRVAQAADARRVFANVVDDAALSSFHVPAIVDRAPLIIAVSSGGAAPMLARWVRERIEILFDGTLGSLAGLLERKRAAIRARHAEPRARRGFYARLLDGRVWQMLRNGRGVDAERELDRVLQQQPARRAGSVALVGAGPGDAGLLTLRALRALNEADVIVHDRLVGAEVLELARRDAHFIDVGKQARNHQATQEQIHALLLQHARAGKRIVRLKGGDPFVFGRGGEELEFLRAHGIAYEVVPGITAALACAAYAGVPLTHRDHAQSVRFVTAHCRQSLDTLDWRALAAERQTLAIYMGVAQLETLRAKLLEHGRSAHTPFALIENGSTPLQRVIAGVLDDVARLASRHAVQSPALLIVGEVAALAPRLAWFGAAPLLATPLAHAA